MLEFRLHAFELAYALTLMRVEAVAALPNAVLFPKDPAVRRKALAEGEKRLVASGLVRPTGPGSADYDEGLLRLGAAIADPRLTIHTRREGSDGKRAELTIYMNRVDVVEVTQVDRCTFRLRAVEDAVAAMHRVRKMAGVRPTPPIPEAAVELRIEKFDAARRLAKSDPSASVDELEEAGLAREAAEALALALTAARRRGTVAMLRHVAQRVDDVRVIGFYTHAEATWIATTVAGSASRVRVESVSSEGFLRRLVERLSVIEAANHAPRHAPAAALATG